MSPEPINPIDECVRLGNLLAKLERENAALREDKERLDWLIQFGGATFYKRLPHSLSEAYIAIDTRRKEDPSGRR